MSTIFRVIEFIQRSKRGKRIETEPSPYLPWKMSNRLITLICLSLPFLVYILLGMHDLTAYMRGETARPFALFDWWWMIWVSSP
jgi:hypothetical protein